MTMRALVFTVVMLIFKRYVFPNVFESLSLACKNDTLHANAFLKKKNKSVTIQQDSWLVFGSLFSAAQPGTSRGDPCTPRQSEILSHRHC